MVGRTWRCPQDGGSMVGWEGAGGWGLKMTDAPVYDLVVVSDQVVLGERVVPAGIAVSGEQIAAVLEADLARQPGLAATTLDLTGKVILPGPIDAHVHHRTLNASVDSWESLTKGAALGGITTVSPYIQVPDSMALGEGL